MHTPRNFLCVNNMEKGGIHYTGVWSHTLSNSLRPQNLTPVVCKLNLICIDKPMLGASTTPAWHVLKLWMGEWPPVENTLNKQPLTNNKGWSPRLEVGRGANNPS
jgi:hypothetical protein